VGYRHFDKYDIEPLFPFGHGLSYTEFEYCNLRLSAQRFAQGETLALSLSVANTGAVAGAEVVQLYIADQRPGEDRPRQSLKGFQKVWLEPGEKKLVSMTLAVEELNIFCPRENTWQSKPGTYSARIGSSSRDIRLEATFYIVAESSDATL